jgi:SAM-dependent methyltransferase
MHMQSTARKPRQAGVSRLSPHADYLEAKRFYRDEAVADDYDRHRFGSRRRRRRDARKWRALQRAFALAEGVRTTLDVPCGTGRFTDRLVESGYDVIATDISSEMMSVARRSVEGHEGMAGFVQAEAEALPFRDGALDCVMSIRFLFHADGPTRVRILQEMRRVTRRWLIVDYRHRYNVHYWVWRIKRQLGLTDAPLERVTRAQMEAEFAAAGVSVRKVFPVTRVFSDKWIVIGETKTAA